jgi:serine/threonine protein phosphatase PrpC
MARHMTLGCLAAHQQDEDLGLSCQPSRSGVVRLEPGTGPGVLVLASDGLWDVTDAAAVADVVMRFLPDGPQAGPVVTEACCAGC